MKERCHQMESKKSLYLGELKISTTLVTMGEGPYMLTSTPYRDMHIKNVFICNLSTRTRRLPNEIDESTASNFRAV